MLRDCDWSLDRDYKTGTENEPLQFYLHGLANSTEFQLLLGYFSSAAINLLSIGFATFISKGGKMKMVINHLLSEKDKQTVQKAENLDNNAKTFDLYDAVTLGKILDEYDNHFFECLSYMISEKRIEIKIIKPKNNRGISHYKSGVFSDGENFVGYKASCNFTLYGLSENLEELEVFLDWENGRSNKLIKKQIKVIDSYFTEKDNDVEYLSANEIEIAIRDKFPKKDIEDLIVKEEELIKKKISLFENKNVREIILNLYNQNNIANIYPKFPYKDGPRQYQQTAFLNWKNGNQQGLFAMATGTGKTITSLNCLLQIYNKTGYFKALILVPTITLVNQWEQECKKFNFTTIIKVCSTNKDWNNNLATIILQERLSQNSNSSYIVISTYASLARPHIFSELNKLSVKTLLIADECHNMGSVTLLNILDKLKFKRRIGLSATPERQFDEVGTKKILEFFNSLNGYTYEFSMKLAIQGDKVKNIDPVLCRYYYYPHMVTLTESEMTEYIKLSLRIAKYFNAKIDNFDKNDTILTALLLARKRIIHKAFNKVSIFDNIIRKYYLKNKSLKYTLVYVPEGNDTNDYYETDYFSQSDESDNDLEASHLIDVYTNTVKKIDNKITVNKFISGTNEKDKILDEFARGTIDVLTSMKCLDEGVDLPRAELAIFCSSSDNPRQFVQRRGRILRQHPDKQFAFIHDLVVVPEVSSNIASFEMERSMLKKELTRVKNFASLSENSSHTIDVFTDTLNHYNLNLYNNE